MLLSLAQGCFSLDCFQEVNSPTWPSFFHQFSHGNPSVPSILEKRGHMWRHSWERDVRRVPGQALAAGPLWAAAWLLSGHSLCGQPTCSWALCALCCKGSEPHVHCWFPHVSPSALTTRETFQRKLAALTMKQCFVFSLYLEQSLQGTAFQTIFKNPIIQKKRGQRARVRKLCTKDPTERFWSEADKIAAMALSESS